MGTDMIVRAFPVLPGKEEDVRRFAEEVRGPRDAEASAFYARLGVARETWYLQETEAGWLFLGATQIVGRPVDVAAEQYSSSDLAFDRWFKDQVRALTGIDPDVQPAGPATECIFDSAALGAALESRPTGTSNNEALAETKA